MNQQQPKIIIIGAGFAGLNAAQKLARQATDILLIDRTNFHTFTPLLYQVATCGIDPSETAYPIRNVFNSKSNVRFLMGEVTDISTSDKSVTVQTINNSLNEHYDFLIIAAGSVTNYFNNDEFRNHSYSIKTLSDTVRLRNHVLKLFEQAAWSNKPEYRTALTNIVIVGGGATGIETAGALQELYNDVLRNEYRDLQAHVTLIEASDRLLPAFPEKLRASSLKQLSSLGVKVILNSSVLEIGDGYVKLENEQRIPTYTVVWATGVKASPLATMLNVQLQKGGRIPVHPTLAIIGHENIYAIGDIAYLIDPNQKPFAQLAPIAQQEGSHAGRNILRRIHGQAETDFHYRDRGIMATIGRSRAVAWLFNRIQLSGFPAWAMWLGLHLIWLVGYRNKASVFVSWVWNYLTYDRSVRIILEHEPTHEPSPETAAEKQV